MEHCMPGMPALKPDELLYSVVARSARHLGHWSPKALNEAVYGRRNVLACPTTRTISGQTLARESPTACVVSIIYTFVSVFVPA
jgi:hypothetical protein